MKRILLIVAVLVGVGLMAIAVMASMQLRALATTPNASAIDDYPLVKMIGGDLIAQKNPESPTPEPPKPGMTKPEVLAQRIQTRILGVGGLGIVVILIGIGIMFAGRGDKRPDEAQSSA